MKILLIVNIVIAMLLDACFWTFAFFTHGAFVHPIGLLVGGLCGWFGVTPLLFAVLVMFIIDIFGAFKFWDEHGWKTLLPFLVLGIAIFGLTIWDVQAMSIKRFNKYLPDYESYVATVKREHKQGNWDVSALPKEYKHLGYLSAAYDNEPNILFVSIDVGNFGVFGHTAFLYSSNGAIAKDSRAYKSWHYRDRVNEHWFRVSD